MYSPIISTTAILMNVIVYEKEIYFNLTCVKVVAGVRCVCNKKQMYMKKSIYKWIFSNYLSTIIVVNYCNFDVILIGRRL